MPKAKDSKQFPDGHKRENWLIRSNAESCQSISFLLTSREIPKLIIGQIWVSSWEHTRTNTGTREKVVLFYLIAY